MNKIFVNEVACQYCRKMIPSSNRELHEARCENLMKKQEKLNNYNPFQQQVAQSCSICFDKFSNRQQLDDHMRQCSQINQPITCRNCNEIFPQFLMEEHNSVCQQQSNQRSSQNNRYQKQNQRMNSSDDSQHDKNSYNGLYDDDDEEEEQEQGGYSQQLRINRKIQTNQIHVDMEDEENFDDDQEVLNDNEGDDDDDYYNEESKQNRELAFTEDQINSILDRGGQLPNFEDHDQSNTGGLNNQEIEVFPTTKFDPKKNVNLSKDQLQCSICLDEFERFQLLKTLGCLHRFHKKCINHWLIKNKLCPICKMDQKKFL